jgi:hypothetical protein
MGSIIGWLAGKGLSERAARVAAWLMAAIAVFAILSLLAGLWRVFDWWDDRRAVEAAVAKANVKALGTAREADDSAAAQAARDDRIIAMQLEEVKHAIANVESDAPGAVAVAHSCQRLRRHGFAEADLPPACRDRAAAGSQARADH